MPDWSVRRVFHPDAPVLDQIVGPEDRFLADYYTQAPLVGERTSLDLFPSAADLWENFLTSGTRQPAFRLVRAGDSTGRGGVTRAVGIGNRRPNDVVDANAVIDRYRRGDTVVLQALHQTSPALARLATNLSLALDQPTQVNAYLSPAADQGLDVHFDYHDVIVVQLAGSKHWRIWHPLKRTTDPVRTKPKTPAPTLDELGEPEIERTLAPGDVLYLPRGFPHVATTTDEASDHLTIGITSITWNRFVDQALDAAVSAGSFRHSLPARSLDGASQLPAPPTLDPIATAMKAANYRHWMAQQVWQRMPQTRLRPMTEVAANLEASYRFSPGPLLWLTTVADRTVIGLGDRLLDLPISGHGFLSAIWNQQNDISPAKIGGDLDTSSRGVVIRRLLREGVLAPIV